MSYKASPRTNHLIRNKLASWIADNTVWAPMSMLEAIGAGRVGVSHIADKRPNVVSLKIGDRFYEITVREIKPSTSRRVSPHE